MTETPLSTLRRQTGAVAIELAFRGLSRAGKLHPAADLRAQGIEVTKNVPYVAGGDSAHFLDVYRPPGPGPFPTVLYIHGGGFRILSKETHWIMAAGFARQGYLVFNIDYRLAPRHPFPAAVEDACAAYRFVVEHGAAFGADLNRLVVAGESAGANLTLGISLACATERPEPYAKEVFALDHMPAAFIPFCGLHQVSDVERFIRRREDLPRVIVDRMENVSGAYLGGRENDLGMADPLCVYEALDGIDRPLSPFFVPIGTADPILDDSRRLHTALQGLGVDSTIAYYPGEVHAFHAFVWRKRARDCWSDTYGFLDRVLERR